VNFSVDSRSGGLSGDDFVRVFPESELAVGQMRCAEVDGHAVVICRIRDGLHAVDAVCTHAYSRLDEGRLRGHRLICPLHGASFDVRNGAVLGAPATEPLRCHEARSLDGYIEVRLTR
jgi:3-phenylpropionate/trans-cinnamate dioxygenase ferredoxin subunit